MISRIIKKIIYLYKIHIQKDCFLIQARKWFKDQGDTKLRFSYPINKNSIVFDLGGYKGDFAAEINNRYNCKVYLFEPSPTFYNECKERFKNNKKITCFNFGISSNSKKALLSNNNNKSSTKLTTESCNDHIPVELISFSEFLNNEKIENIDLLKINIEGGEYDILPHIIEKNLIQHIKYLQIQFHNFFNDAEKNRAEITHNLSKTHQQQWCYPFIWESWERKEKLPNAQ